VHKCIVQLVRVQKVRAGEVNHPLRKGAGQWHPSLGCQVWVPSICGRGVHEEHEQGKREIQEGLRGTLVPEPKGYVGINQPPVLAKHGGSFTKALTPASPERGSWTLGSGSLPIISREWSSRGELTTNAGSGGSRPGFEH